MKNFLIFSLLLSFSTLSAQSGWCGSAPSERFLRDYSAQDRSNYQSYLSNRGTIRWIPIRYHIITKTDGTGGVSLREIFTEHCEMNSLYNQFDIGFFIQGIDTISDTNLWEYQDGSLGWDAFSKYNRSNVCNVYINGNLPGLCGFATFPGSSGSAGGGLFLNKSCLGAKETTFAHEMGHYLGLLHTFETGLGVELVNGSNCTFAGDRFCDTPADFLDARTACPYIGNQTDPNGDLYRTVIDPTLIMSYFSDYCVSRFSPMQIAEMNRVLTNERSYLLNTVPPNLNTPSTVEMIYPLDGEVSVNSANTVFKWKAVDNAWFYQLRLQSASSSLVVSDTIITDTVFVTGALAADKKYRFFVKAISFGNTCGSTAPYQNIHTSINRATVTVNSPSCANGMDGYAVITPTSGTPPFSYQWADGTQDSIAYGLSRGNYFVTMVDNNGIETVQLVSVVAPPPFNVHFNTGNNSILALPTGGTVPYTFAWSNGFIGQFNNNVPYGNYSVTVTDAKGCSSIQTFLYNSLEDETESGISMKVFPNPLRVHGTITVQLEMAERADATISLFNINGTLITQMNRELPSGSHQLPLSIGNLPSGIYLLRLQTGKAIRTERISVLGY
ncbi:MAG: T9SS type A sorting domain-containing protein [Bacteroidetes bacterium]|nr:T9SS type A sorting domain-containing protein [Bacteroidota bacterium]